jgi:hypothetical protein
MRLIIFPLVQTALILKRVVDAEQQFCFAVPVSLLKQLKPVFGLRVPDKNLRLSVT